MSENQTRKLFSTFAKGPDGRVFDLSRTRFPKDEDYIPVNAWTQEVEEELLKFRRGLAE